MNGKLRRAARAVTLISATALFHTGCMFQMTHQFPSGTRFDREADAKVVRKVDRFEMKNYLLQGIVPWSSFGTQHIAKPPRRGQHLSGAQVTTSFNAADTVIWVVPGFFYGYYVWAPRHVGVTADVVEGDTRTVPAGER